MRRLEHQDTPPRDHTKLDAIADAYSELDLSLPVNRPTRNVENRMRISDKLGALPDGDHSTPVVAVYAISAVRDPPVTGSDFRAGQSGWHGSDCHESPWECGRFRLRPQFHHAQPLLFPRAGKRD